MASGSTFKEASGGLMKLLKVIIPTKEILTNFEKAVQPLFDMQENNEDESIRLSVLRDTLLPKLMSGELSVEEVSFDKLAKLSFIRLLVSIFSSIEERIETIFC